MFKVINKNTGSGVFIVKFQHISHLPAELVLHFVPFTLTFEQVIKLLGVSFVKFEKNIFPKQTWPFLMSYSKLCNQLHIYYDVSQLTSNRYLLFQSQQWPHNLFKVDIKNFLLTLNKNNFVLVFPLLTLSK